MSSCITCHIWQHYVSFWLFFGKFIYYSQLFFFSNFTKLFFSKVDDFWNEDSWKLPMSAATFLGDNWSDEIKALKQKVNTQETFKKRFFHWFDAFKILKFVHFCRDEFYQNVELEEALDWLRQKHFILKGSKESYLIQLRYLDRNFK